MAWNPQTKFGQLVQKGLKATTSVVSVLGGGTILGTVATAAGKIIDKGTTVLAKTTGVLNNLKARSDAVKENAKNLVSGYTSELNKTNLAAKEKLRDTIETATKSGVVTTADNLQAEGKKPFNLMEFIKSPVVLAVLGVAATLVLPKLLKR